MLPSPHRISLDDAGDEELEIAAAEDAVLSKLAGYSDGGETSEHQWGDLLGVLKVQSESLDHAYLKQWAETLGLADLLALNEAGS